MPNPPDCEPAFILVWMMIAENYDVDHFSVSGEGMSANTFVRLW